MGKITGISWTDHTFNPWWGCAKISAGCANCYAERDSKRYGFDIWGPTAPRRFFSDKHWNEPLTWNRAAERDGVRRRVLCGSMCDVFESRDICDEGGHNMLDCARVQLFKLIEQTPMLDWLLLTKRLENVMDFVPELYKRGGWPSNVWIGTTAENQEWADRRAPKLLEIPARIHFLSCEPLLGPVDISRWLQRSDNEYRGLRVSGSQNRRAGDRREWKGVADCEALSRPQERESYHSPMHTQAGRKEHEDLSSDSRDGRGDTIQRAGPQTGMASLPWRDSFGVDHQSQEWEQVGQQTRQLGTCDVLGAGTSRLACAESWAHGPARRTECDGETYTSRCCEDQGTTDKRGEIDNHSSRLWSNLSDDLEDCPNGTLALISWCIVGGESGPRARPMHPAWARSLRDQCQAAGVPFFFKSFGEWLPESQIIEHDPRHWPRFSKAKFGTLDIGGEWNLGVYPARFPVDEQECMYRLGKRNAGNLLDGKTWSELPKLQNCD